MTQWVTYLHSLLMARAKQSDLTPDRLQELRTLCEVLNLFGQGKVTVAADVLIQRFKALEQRALGQSVSAHGLELVAAQRSGLWQMNKPTFLKTRLNHVSIAAQQGIPISPSKSTSCPFSMSKKIPFLNPIFQKSNF